MEDPVLEMRPNCELCDKDLPPQSFDAQICSYECTYCTDCVEKLENVCPTCGGGFAPRPIRPRRSWRSELNLGLAGWWAGRRLRRRSRRECRDGCLQVPHSGHGQHQQPTSDDKTSANCAR